MNILIADDQVSNRKILIKHLEVLGYGSEFDQVEDGKEVMDAFKSKSYDIIFLDVIMPFINGLDLCTTIKAQYSTKVVFITSYTDFDSEVKRVGADAYIKKPFLVGDIANALSTLGINNEKK
jgi:CheY-like chemotaxis protein